MALLYFKNIQCVKQISLRIPSSVTQIYTNNRTIKSTQAYYKSSKVEDTTDDPDKPIEFLKSDAARWKAHVSRSGTTTSAPWFQPYVIAVSLSVFMLYFFYLREESDIDLEFNTNLYQRISGLEERQLELVLEYNKTNNLPTADIEQRLKEIRSDKK